jgi:choline kinase
VDPVKCLIIAAGKGERIRSRGESKPLISVLGVPLIERVVRSVTSGGVDEFVVVTGYNGSQVRAFLDGASKKLGVTITHVKNEEWDKPNGLSVLKATHVLREPFLLSMSDHIFDPTVVADILQTPPSEGEVVLAVDYRTDNPMIDLEAVTRVRTEDGLIRDIGKGLQQFDAFDTGLFYATTALFDSIALSGSRDGDLSISGGMRLLADTGRARAFDIGDRFWLDVDVPDEIDSAEASMLEAHSAI